MTSRLRLNKSQDVRSKRDISACQALKEHGQRIKRNETRKRGLLHTHRVNGNIKPQTATIHPWPALVVKACISVGTDIIG